MFVQKLVTQMTDEELRKEDYDLELESQHYDYRADGETDPESQAYFQSIQDGISFRRMVISIEELKRMEARHYDRLAEVNDFERMQEAA